MIDMLKRLKFCMVLAVASCVTAFAQMEEYALLEGRVESPSSVVISLKTYAKSKKAIDYEAKCAAIRIILFDGLPNTIYNKPLLVQGVAIQEDYPVFFNDLFLNKTSYYIKDCKRESDYKKAFNGEKTTLYTVRVNYIQLKKDLEKANIKKQLGI